VQSRIFECLISDETDRLRPHIRQKMESDQGLKERATSLSIKCLDTISPGFLDELSNLCHTWECPVWDTSTWEREENKWEECRLLGYKNPVRTSQETHYVSAIEYSQLMLCKIWLFHGRYYEEWRPLEYTNPVRTSQETHYVSTAESSHLMLWKIWSFHGGDYEECRLLGRVWLLNTSTVVQTCMATEHFKCSSDVYGYGTLQLHFRRVWLLNTSAPVQTCMATVHFKCSSDVYGYWTLQLQFRHVWLLNT
jgi:hypothetical protein